MRSMCVSGYNRHCYAALVANVVILLVRGEREGVVEESLSTPNDAEMKVVGGLLLRPEALGRVAELLRPDDFAHERHRLIYATLLSLSQEHAPISVQAVCELLEQQGSLRSG